MNDRFFYDGDGQVLALREDGIWFFDDRADTALVLPYPKGTAWHRLRAQQFAGRDWSEGFVLLDIAGLEGWWTGHFPRREDGSVDTKFAPVWHFLNLLEQRV